MTASWAASRATVSSGAPRLEVRRLALVGAGFAALRVDGRRFAVPAGFFVVLRVVAVRFAAGRDFAAGARFAVFRLFALPAIAASPSGLRYAASQAARSRFSFIMSASRVYIMWPAS